MNAAVALADVERPLALFAQGISGRPYQIQPEHAFDGNLERIQGAALHNPTTLYLPESFESYGDRSANLGGLRLMALHQLCYREFGSHDFTVTRARALCPELAARVAPEIGARDSDLTALFGHFALPVLARTLFRIIEAMRIDYRMRESYPGIEPHYARFAAYEQRRRGIDVIADLGSLLDALILYGLGADREWLADRDLTGIFATLADEVREVEQTDADVYTTCAAMTRCYRVLEASADVAALAVDEAFEAPDIPAIHGDAPLEWLQRENRLEQWQEELGSLQLSLDELDALDLLDSPDAPRFGTSAPAIDALEGTAATGDAHAGETRPEGLEVDDRRDLEGRRDALQRRIDMENANLSVALGAPTHPGKSFLYDEWDEPGQRYLRAWCRLFEIPLEPIPGEDGEAALKNIAALREAVRRRFEHLRPQAYTRRRKVLDGDELDWDQVIAYRVDRHRTATPDERVYQRRDRTNRDVSAAFLVDLSASTDDPVVPPESVAAPATDPDSAPNLRDPFDDDTFLWSLDPAADEREPGRRVIDVQRDALLLMSDALDRLGDRFGVFGFSGYGRDCVEFYVAKDFNAPWNGRAVNALAAMKPRRSTRMGPAIRHGIRRLNRDGGALKVMIVVSDGFPQDCDYGPDRGSHDYGVADTAKALQEAERAGIATFCITVDPSGHDYLKRMCDARRYMIIDEIETLPEALSKVYEALTT